MGVRVRWPLGITAVLVWLLVGDALAQPPVQAGDLEAAKVAWKQRQERVRSLRATLTKEITTHQGMYKVAKGFFGEYPTPANDPTNVYNCTLTVKGDRLFKLFYTGQKWSPVTRKMEPVDSTEISSPDARILFDTRGSSPYPIASHSTRREMSGVGGMSVFPLVLAVRPDQLAGTRLADYTPTGKTVAIEGRNCVEFVTGSQTEGRTKYMYLDPGRDWVARRIDTYAKEKLMMRMTAEYTANSLAGWLPSEWSYVMNLADGTPLESGRVIVGRYEVNPEVADDEFQPKYSPGTFVVDDTQGLGEMASVVKDDGSRGVAIPLSHRPTYEQLVEANRSVRRQRIWLFVLGGGVLLLSLLVVLSYRRHRARRVAGGTVGGAPPTS